MAALALAEAPAALVPGPQDHAGDWSTEDVETYAGLLEAIDADEAHYLAGDWLLSREPMAPPDQRTGSHGRINELARRVGRSGSYLRQLRTVSYAWPREYRPSIASWHVCRIYTDGGPERAPLRLRQLEEEVARGPRGRVTVDTFREWRQEHPGPRTIVVGKHTAPEGSPPEVIELVQRCDNLLEDTGRLVTADVLPTSCRPSLDALIAAIHGVAEALVKAKLI